MMAANRGAAPGGGPGAWAAAQRSPCERCDRRDYGAECYRDCPERQAFLAGEKRDTRFEMEIAPAPVARAPLREASRQDAKGAKESCLNHPERPRHRRTSFCRECCRDRARAAYRLRRLDTRKATPAVLRAMGLR